jgi:hypothetical protein
MGGPSQTESRRNRRSNVFLTAALEAGGASRPVTLRNLSHEGALVQGPDLPGEGDEIVFRRKDLSVPGHVAWKHGEFAGIAFRSSLSPAELLRNVPVPARRLEAPPIVRRPGFTSHPLTPGERALIESWARASSTRLGE